MHLTTLNDELSKPPSTKERWQTADWQRLWLTTQAHEWKTLALVPAGSGAPKDFTLEIAMALARTGMAHLGVLVHVADAASLTIGSSGQFAAQVRETTAYGPVLIATASCVDNPVTQSIAQSADCAVLCVRLGVMRMSEAKKTLRAIGPNRFIGSLVVR